MIRAIKRVLTGSMLAALMIMPAAPAYAVPVDVTSVDAFGEFAAVSEFAAPKKTVTVKCYLMNLRNEATGDVVYGTGKDKAAAQADANTKVPRGHKLKHCDVVR
ncbi:hypothetical protein [Nocardia sp. NPDC052316]|uniref:hypothetical protein n=1 Tax=Nocardia sp. NPDC052316 TaxID=3364329 RepID=UPI0037C6200E